MKRIWYYIFISFLFFLSNQIHAESGGPLNPLQAAYDVNYYDLDLNIDPVSQTIDGSLLCRVEVLSSIDTLLLDLDSPFIVSSVLIKINEGDESEAIFSHVDFKLYIIIPVDVSEGDLITVRVFYSGAPRIAENPPWGVGFVWETTMTGDPWLGVACEDEGADIWWPCKDHPSDEPDSMYLSLTVPNPLVCVSNGRFINSEDNGDNTSTFHWFISTPINNYNVTFYAAEFSLIEDTYQSISGESIPFYFWVIPYKYDEALAYMDVFLNEFNFLESICGPFPFATDKHGWAHAPYYGMEHQTIIAYGNNFSLNNWGYDYIHYHELAHEWWGNHISANNWADIWIHEGMATYTEALYAEHLYGIDGYIQFMRNIRPNDYHSFPLAPREELTASEGFDLNPYRRGAAAMHTLRYHIGDDNLFELLKRWIYPDPDDLDNTNGRQCRMLSTEDMKEQAEEVTNMDLTAFFEAFFREASYPDLHVSREFNQTTFSWETENGIPLDLNIPVLINGEEYTVEMTEGLGSIEMTLFDELEIDPDKWILMSNPTIIVSLAENDLHSTNNYLLQNYPNPFSQNTVIEFSLVESQFVKLSVYNLLGQEVIMLLNNEMNAGVHEISVDVSQLSEGDYIYQIESESLTETKQFTVIR